jgi:hypothetical protein
MKRKEKEQNDVKQLEGLSTDADEHRRKKWTKEAGTSLLLWMNKEEEGQRGVCPYNN